MTWLPWTWLLWSTTKTQYFFCPFANPSKMYVTPKILNSFPSQTTIINWLFLSASLPLESLARDLVHCTVFSIKNIRLVLTLDFDKLWNYFDWILTGFWLNFDCNFDSILTVILTANLTAFWLHFDCIFTVFWLHFDCNFDWIMTS